MDTEFNKKTSALFNNGRRLQGTGELKLNVPTPMHKIKAQG